MMFKKTDKKLSKLFAKEISKLIKYQLKLEPIVIMKSSQVHMQRAKLCLAIYNFAFFIFQINSLLRFKKERVKFIIDTTYNIFFEKYIKKYFNKIVIISDIVVNPIEEVEIIRLSKEWGIDYELNVSTPLDNLFPIIYEYRIPIYLEKISQMERNIEKNIILPDTPVTSLFTSQFLAQDIPDFSIMFHRTIHLETYKRITNLVLDKICR